MTTPTICADCGGFCTSRSAPPRCWECRRRDQAGEFWSPDELLDGRWVVRRGIQVWQPEPDARAVA